MASGIDTHVYPFRHRPVEVAEHHGYWVNVHHYTDTWNSEVVVSAAQDSDTELETVIVRAVLDFYRARAGGEV